jgi:hypothetical protein
MVEDYKAVFDGGFTSRSPTLSLSFLITPCRKQSLRQTVNAVFSIEASRGTGGYVQKGYYLHHHRVPFRPSSVDPLSAPLRFVVRNPDMRSFLV